MYEILFSQIVSGCVGGLVALVLNGVGVWLYEKWKNGTIRKSRNNNNVKNKDHNNNEHDGVDDEIDDPNTIPSTSGSSCPFAMVAPPMQ